MAARTAGAAFDEQTVLIIDGDDSTRRLLAAKLALAGANVPESAPVVGSIAISDKLASLDGFLIDSRLAARERLCRAADPRDAPRREGRLREDQPIGVDALIGALASGPSA